MLEPESRQLLFESLRPPADYELDLAVGTTYSLDLLALLTAPLAFAAFESDASDLTAIDPIEMLQLLRRYASQITVFCDAGRIQVPAKNQALYAYLEKSVIEVTAPTEGGVFHPKVWVLRYTSSLSATIRYRVLVLSRNLTFDRSWDTLLALDGVVRDRTLGYARNRPLADFVASLPTLAKHGSIRKDIRETIDLVAQELRIVDFDLPPEFEDLSFWPLGIEGYQSWPFGKKLERILVISPFIAPETLKKLAPEGKNVLVSRPESFDTLERKSLSGYSSIYEFKPDADLNAYVGDEGGAQATNESVLRGLHAKLYIGDAGWDSRVWTGSANATEAAFERNVEFLVELVGKKSKIGIEVCLERKKGVTNFIDLLQPLPATPPPATIDPEQRALEGLAETIRKSIALAKIVATIEPATSLTFRIQLRMRSSQGPKYPSSATVTCRPITVGDAARTTLNCNSDLLAEFSNLSFEALTSFYAFELTVKKGHRSVTQNFVLNLQLEGVPEDREQRILTTTLKDRSQVLRFLMLLLAWDVSPITDSNGSSQQDNAARWGSATTSELFEAMMEAVARSPQRLDEIERLVKDLSGNPGGATLLPDQFEKIWIPIQTARERMRQ